MSDSSWRFSSSPKSERELLELALVLGELLAHALALPLEGLAQVLLLPLAALAELLDRERRQLLGARLELRQELLDVARRRVEELAAGSPRRARGGSASPSERSSRSSVFASASRA